ncbi:MAG: MFS transporter [Pseudomonadota bacterium]
MTHRQREFLYLNIGHFLDHFVLLIFATAAAVQLADEWQLSYAELVPYATPGFVAFGVCAIPAGWLADRWSRPGMMVVFFFGIGAACLLAARSQSPVEMSIALGVLGVFAAIYHPVGLSMVVQGRTKTGMPLAINGVWGNLGVASAALVTGLMIDWAGWRVAFVATGVLCLIVGAAYAAFVRRPADAVEDAVQSSTSNAAPNYSRALLIRVFGVIFFTTAVGGLVFQSTTFALPKILDERLGEMTQSATSVGVYSFLVFSLAALAQLVVGFLLDRHDVKRIFAAVALTQAVLFAFMVSLSGAAALVVAVGFMLAVFGQIPINDVLVGRMAKSEWRSRAFAARYIVTFSVMASAVPLIGWLHGTWGFSALFTVLAIAASAIFLGTLALPSRVEPDPA